MCLVNIATSYNRAPAFSYKERSETMKEIEMNENIKKRVRISFKREPDIPLIIENTITVCVIEFSQPMLRVVWESLNNEIVVSYYELESILAYSVLEKKEGKK